MKLSLQEMFRKICCVLMVSALVCALPPQVRGRTDTITLTAGSSRATVNGQTVTMLVPPVVDSGSQQVLVPIGFLARQIGFTVSQGSAGSLKLVSPSVAIVVTPGRSSATVGDADVALSVETRGLLGEVLVAAPDVHLLLPVVMQNGTDTREFIFTRTVDDPVVSGPVDTGAVTFATYHAQVFQQSADFSVVRIDMTGKGIRVLSCQSAGGWGTGRYPSTYVQSLKPLALMNATPFNMTSYAMSGSVQDRGVPVNYTGTYIATIGIDQDNVPFYAEGMAHAAIRLSGGKDLSVLRVNQTAADTAASGCSLYSNYYRGGISVASSEVLLVLQGTSTIRTVSGSYFTPHSLSDGQLAVYFRRPDLVAAVRSAASVTVHTFIGTRDCTGSSFLQCGPVVVRAGKPYLDYRKYKDINRATKLGSRAFIGMDDQRHLFFIVTPARVRLQFGDVSLALARLKLFTYVVTLDGGTSTTLYYKGRYVIKGGRALTNVLCVPSR